MSRARLRLRRPARRSAPTAESSRAPSSGPREIKLYKMNDDGVPYIAAAYAITLFCNPPRYNGYFFMARTLLSLVCFQHDQNWDGGVSHGGRAAAIHAGE